MRLETGDVLPIEIDASRRGAVNPGDDVEQRGLAGAVGAYETGDAAAVDGEGNAIDGANAAKVHV